MRLFIAALLVSLPACSQIQGRDRAPVPTRSEWGAILVTTDSLVERGRFTEADSVLVRFERVHAGSRPALEVPFWRALYKLDPRNTTALPGEGVQMLEAYADSPHTWWYKAEANVLRYLVRQVETLRGRVAPMPIVAGDNTPAGMAARDQEIQTLRAELARVNAELERIKRRLASPTP